MTTSTRITIEEAALLIRARGLDAQRWLAQAQTMVEGERQTVELEDVEWWIQNAKPEGIECEQ